MVVLPVPLTPTTRTTPGWPSLPETCSRRSRSGPTRLTSSSRSTVRGVAGLGAVDPQPGAQPLDELLGRLDADVGGQQGVLDRLPGVLVEPVAGEQREQAAPEAALRAGRAAGAAAPAATPCLPASRASAPSTAASTGGRPPPAPRCLRGGASTSVRRRVGGSAGCRRRRPPATRPHDERRHDGDGDDQVEPVTHGHHPTSRGRSAPKCRWPRWTLRRGAGRYRCPAWPGTPARRRSRPGWTGCGRYGGLGLRVRRRRRLGGHSGTWARPRRSAAPGAAAHQPPSHGAPGRSSPRCGKATYATTTPASSTITTIAITIWSCRPPCPRPMRGSNRSARRARASPAAAG